MAWRRRRRFCEAGVAVLALGFGTTAAIADDDVTIRIEARPDAAAARQIQFNVSGSGGRFDHADATQISVPMALHAAMTPDAEDRKIVTSILVLKSSDKSSVTAFDGTEPQSDLSLEKTFTIPVDGKSKVAQDAIAACNALPKGPKRGDKVPVASIKVPIIWRITTGKFTFRWTNYDSVPPSEDFVKNPDFYGERKSFEQEKTFDINVSCAASPEQPVAKAPPPVAPPAQPPVTAPVEAAAPKTPPTPPPAAPDSTSVAAPKGDMLPMKSVAAPAAPPPPAPPSPPPEAATAPAAMPAPETTVQPETPKSRPVSESEAASASYLASPKRPECAGGNVRQIHSGPDAFLCLCPSDTSRVELGLNAFECRKKRSR